MRHVVALLRAHGDLTKLEFEDGLIRKIIPGRLDVESSLFGIDADLRAESQANFGAAAVSGAPSAVLTLSSLDEAGPAAEEIEDMVIDVASPAGVYVTESTTIGEDTPAWVGNATPGTKLMVFLRRSSGAESFTEWLETLAADIGAITGPGRVRVHRVVEVTASSPELEAIVTVRFPTAADITSAEEAGLAALLDDTDVADTSARLLTFEHRFSADPNHWGAAGASPPTVA